MLFYRLIIKQTKYDIFFNLCMSFIFKLFTFAVGNGMSYVEVSINWQIFDY